MYRRSPATCLVLAAADRRRRRSHSPGSARCPPPAQVCRAAYARRRTSLQRMDRSCSCKTTVSHRVRNSSGNRRLYLYRKARSVLARRPGYIRRYNRPSALRSSPFHVRGPAPDAIRLPDASFRGRQFPGQSGQTWWPALCDRWRRCHDRHYRFYTAPGIYPRLSGSCCRYRPGRAAGRDIPSRWLSQSLQRV